MGLCMRKPKADGKVKSKLESNTLKAFKTSKSLLVRNTILNKVSFNFCVVILCDIGKLTTPHFNSKNKVFGTISLRPRTNSYYRKFAAGTLEADIEKELR